MSLISTCYIFTCENEMTYSMLPTNWTRLCVLATLLPDVESIPRRNLIDYLIPRHKRVIQFMPHGSWSIRGLSHQLRRYGNSYSDTLHNETQSHAAYKMAIKSPLSPHDVLTHTFHFIIFKCECQQTTYSGMMELK